MLIPDSVTTLSELSRGYCGSCTWSTHQERHTKMSQAAPPHLSILRWSHMVVLPQLENGSGRVIVHTRSSSDLYGISTCPTLAFLHNPLFSNRFQKIAGISPFGLLLRVVLPCEAHNRNSKTTSHRSKTCFSTKKTLLRQIEVGISVVLR